MPHLVVTTQQPHAIASNSTVGIGLKTEVFKNILLSL
jgi:hypothetical protein